MYYNHQLRTNLQEWKNQLYKTHSNDVVSEFKFFMTKLTNEPVIAGIIDDIIITNPVDEESYNKWKNNFYRYITFNDEEERFSYFWKTFKHLVETAEYYNDYDIYRLRGDEGINNFLDRIVTPIVNYIHEQLDEINYVLYILEKYKLRTEWFTKNTLLEKYANVSNKQYEKIFEDDIRLYLFDQGIDYPFSTPKSSSGRADVVSLIDTEDPLVMEIKIYDIAKGYKNDRIIGGFAQIVKYANDYHKNIGYLVVFNLDNSEIVIENKNADNKWPNRVIYNGKAYYIIIINLNYDISASKQVKLKQVTISVDELTSSVQ